MVNTNSTDSVASESSSPARVDQPQPAAQAEEKVAPGPPPSAAVQANSDAEVVSGSPPTEPGNPKLSPSAQAPFQQSSRVWRSGEPYYPLPISHDGDHWKKLYEKTDQFDKEFCTGWNSEIDSLLTFAGLFSAVVTAFAVESYKLLQPDPQDMTNRILLNVSAQLAGKNATELPSGFTPSPSSLRINALWFLSLTFSLTAGLVGILCKQWLRHYQQDISKPPEEALAMRQYRYDAFLRYRVMEILSALPILLGLGLILFFVGLIDFLRGLDMKVSIPVTILIGLGFVFLVVTTSAPALQYVAFIRCYSLLNRSYRTGPPLFAFKSPQSLAILHLITCLYPLSAHLKIPDWASLEVQFFVKIPTLRAYTRRALTWLDETYSHNGDMVRQVCLGLQDVGDVMLVKDISNNRLKRTRVFGESRLAVIEGLVDAQWSTWRPGDTLRGTRDIIAIGYLHPFATSFDQCFTLLEHLIRALNSSRHQIPSLESFKIIFSRLSLQARGHLASAEQVQEMTWQRAILFRNLLSEGRWTDPTKIPWEVRGIFKNLKTFTDEDLDSIFSTLRAWIGQNPQDGILPSHCWANLAASLEPHELDEAFQHRPPARDFIAFLDPQFQMGEGIKYMLGIGCKEKLVRSFFAALDAWIKRNPQDTQSFIHCKRLLTSVQWELDEMRKSPSFRDFEASLEAGIARNQDATEQGPIHDS